MSQRHVKALKRVRRLLKHDTAASPYICDLLAHGPYTDVSGDIRRYIHGSIYPSPDLRHWLLSQGIEPPSAPPVPSGLVYFYNRKQRSKEMRAYRMRYVDHLIEIVRDWP